MSERIAWHRCDNGDFNASLSGLDTDAWARLALIDGEWWWRVFWLRRFDRWSKCADRQEASNQANAALQELLASTEEQPAPPPVQGDFTQRMYGSGIICHPERYGEG